MPRKIRELKRDLRDAGFELQPKRGKGSHTVWKHPLVPQAVILSGADGDDAQGYQEREVRPGIDDARAAGRRPLEATMDDGFTPDELAQARRYALVFRWDDADHIWVVRAPELLSREITHGRTLEEAEAQGVDAVASLVATLPEYAAKRPAAAQNDAVGRRYVLAPAPRYDAAEVRAIRRRLDLSQEVFAELLNVSRGAVRAWEQGQRSPDGAARRLLEIVARQPLAALRPLA